MVQKTIVAKIKSLYLEVLNRSKSRGLPGNFEIHLNPLVAEELKLGNSLSIDGKDILVITNDIIPVIDDQSDIYILDPKWLVD